MFIYVECRDLVECFKLLYLGSDEEPRSQRFLKSKTVTQPQLRLWIWELVSPVLCMGSSRDIVLEGLGMANQN